MLVSAGGRRRRVHVDSAEGVAARSGKGAITTKDGNPSNVINPQVRNLFHVGKIYLPFCLVH
jgi:hypothetical protein